MKDGYESSDEHITVEEYITEYKKYIIPDTTHKKWTVRDKQDGIKLNNLWRLLSKEDQEKVWTELRLAGLLDT